jgi:hypothetical protein
MQVGAFSKRNIIIMNIKNIEINESIIMLHTLKTLDNS